MTARETSAVLDAGVTGCRRNDNHHGGGSGVEGRRSKDKGDGMGGHLIAHLTRDSES